jgi:hypothetical protein
MLLYKKENSLSDASALRTAALALTYYGMDDHPEKNYDLWQCTLCHDTESLTPASGIIKTSIDEIIAIVEANISATVDSHKAYCQYYMGNKIELIENNITYTGSGNIEPRIHYDTQHGFDPIYEPDHIAVVYIGPGTDSGIEFWHDIGPTDENENKLQHKEILTTNDLIIFNHGFPHRISPETWGDTQSDSGLHLVLFMKTS